MLGKMLPTPFLIFAFPVVFLCTVFYLLFRDKTQDYLVLCYNCVRWGWSERDEGLSWKKFDGAALRKT